MKKIQTKYKEAILYMQEHPELSVTKIGARYSVFPLEEVLKIYNESR